MKKMKKKYRVEILLCKDVMAESEDAAIAIASNELDEELYEEPVLSIADKCTVYEHDQEV